MTGAPPPAAITIRAAPRKIVAGSTVALSGAVAGASASTTVQLYASPYHYRGASAVATTETGTTGRYAFRVRPSRDTRYRTVVPGTFVGYARFLLSTIAAYESWGIPSVARPLGHRVFFKAGWRPTGLGQLVHQIARLEGHHRVFSLAIMTDGDPTMEYRIGTLDTVTRVLLG